MNFINVLEINIPKYNFVFSCRPPVIRVSDKVMIPQEEHPEINFVGLLIGPRGNTLKSKNVFKTLTHKLICFSFNSHGKRNWSKNYYSRQRQC